MNSVSTTTLCVLLLVCASWVADAYHCPVASSHCSATVKMRIRVNGVGSCHGKTSANCGAYASATQPCIDTFVDAIKSKKCTQHHLSGAAHCTAKALAAAYANAYVGIKCTGKAHGCGYAHGQANAFACTFAAALVKIAVKAGANKAKCYEAASAMVGVYAAAAADARALACAKNNFRQDFESEFKVRVEKAIVNAYASCWVKCKHGKVNVHGSAGASASSSPVVDAGSGSGGGGGFGLPNDFDPFGHQGKR